MNDEIFLQIQAIELQRLLDNSADDPILAPQLRERLEGVEQALRETRQQPGELLPKETMILPRAAVFLRGGGVQGSEGIRPSLAGEALIQYEKMFIEQAIHDERIAAKKDGRHRRPRGASTPGLLFTGTPRGSFGLEFVPQFHQDVSLLGIHAQSLVHVADALIRVAESDSIDDTVNRTPPRVLQPLRQFLKTLAENEAELRLAFADGSSRALSASQIQTATERLERDVKQEDITVEGTFRGMTRESGFFDLRTSDVEVITGAVADQLTEEDLERIDELINKRCKARLQKTTIRKITGTEIASYVLLDAQSVAPSS